MLAFDTPILCEVAQKHKPGSGERGGEGSRGTGDREASVLSLEEGESAPKMMEVRAYALQDPQAGGGPGAE